MSKGIKVSRKYGLNPTMPVCFWCGEEIGTIALLGVYKDQYGTEIEAPRRMCIGYEPCEECKKKMSMGTTLIETTRKPNKTSNMEISKGIYPTGNWSVLRKEAAERIFGVSEDKLFVDSEIFRKIQEIG